MKTLIGITTFGNVEFTKLAVRGLRETVTEPYELMLVIDKPGDLATLDFANEIQVDFILHTQHKGLCASVNDLYDAAWGISDARGAGMHGAAPSDPKNLIMMSNDVVPYPGCIDEMIRLAERSEWEWISPHQMTSLRLAELYPEARRHFQGSKMIFSDFQARPWEVFLPDLEMKRAQTPSDLVEERPGDVRNLSLLKRSAFEKLGYADVNFWPNGYFEDNDYNRRAILTEVKACILPRSWCFHFWSRTIHQGGEAGTNSKYFPLNEKFYHEKWGGPVDREKFDLPFNGQPKTLLPEGVKLEPWLEIRSRATERYIINHWRNLG